MSFCIFKNCYQEQYLKTGSREAFNCWLQNMQLGQHDFGIFALQSLQKLEEVKKEKIKGSQSYSIVPNMIIQPLT